MSGRALFTDAGRELAASPERIPWEVHPRPLLRRASFLNLCGWWHFSVEQDGKAVETGTDKIRVPFPPESELSGVRRHFAEGASLVYERTVTLPEGFRNGRLLLHVDGADQYAEVFAEGKSVATHAGGYQHFTAELSAVPDTFSLRIVVRDDLTDRKEPYGKQTLTPGGMWYTPFSGLWQPVWLESVPETYIRDLKIRTDCREAVIDTGDATLCGTVTVETPEGNITCALQDGRARIAPPDPRCWTPEDPYLYQFTVRTEGGDVVHSYFALREIAVGTADGKPRILFNGRPIFFHGLLDQGYWSDGLSTPADPSAYETDILAAKRLGFQTLRKHIRVEPDLFYAACDRLGMIVFQDMVNNSDYRFIRDTGLPNLGFLKRDDKKLHTKPEDRRTFRARMRETVDQLFSFPCILYWTIFNEGWGQFDSVGVCEELRGMDDSRIIDAASGWFDQGAGDVASIHVYNRRYRFRPDARPVILSECGGYALRTPDHEYSAEKYYGYGTMKTREALADRVERLFREEVIPAAREGLCGCIYTQLTDVETEPNGILTWDRQVEKLPRDRMLRISEDLSRAVWNAQNVVK